MKNVWPKNPTNGHGWLNTLTEYALDNWENFNQYYVVVKGGEANFSSWQVLTLSNIYCTKPTNVWLL